MEDEHLRNKLRRSRLESLTPRRVALCALEPHPPALVTVHQIRLHPLEPLPHLDLPPLLTATASGWSAVGQVEEEWEGHQSRWQRVPET